MWRFLKDIFAGVGAVEDFAIVGFLLAASMLLALVLALFIKVVP